jgi:5-methylcytosine-specific restriction endonuclease McrA
MNRKHKRRKKKRLTEKMHKKRKGKCFYCGRKTLLGSQFAGNPRQATFDHVKPLSGGGYDKAKNGVLACRACNGAKGSLSVGVFIRRLRGESA